MNTLYKIKINNCNDVHFLYFELTSLLYSLKLELENFKTNDELMDKINIVYEQILRMDFRV